MLKKIIVNIIIGGAMFWLGTIVIDFLNIRDLGYFIVVAGIAYGILSVGFILYKQALPIANESIKKTISEREKNKALEELIKYKNLLNEGILTEDEFAKKSQELKSKLL